MQLRKTVPTALAAALILSACGGDPDGIDAPSPDATAPSTAAPTPSAPALSPTETSAPTPPSETSTALAGDPADEVPMLADTCAIDVPTAEADTVRIAYPEGWQVESDSCEWFDPEAEQLPEATEPAIAVSWRVADVSFSRAADVDDELDDVTRYVGARSGYQAVRIEGESTGRGLRAEGTPVTHWMVDLAPGSDDDRGTLIGTAHDNGGASFAAATYALDRMADTMIVQQPATERFVVTRLDGGGAPLTVTFQQDGSCFELRAGGPHGDIADETCDVDFPATSELSPVLLESGDQRVLAGITSSEIQRVTVPAASGLSGGTTQSIESGHLFALPVRQPPFDITGESYTGEPVTTVTFDG